MRSAGHRSSEASCPATWPTAEARGFGTLVKTELDITERDGFADEYSEQAVSRDQQQHEQRHGVIASGHRRIKIGAEPS
jgi:hypothetical protein